MQAAAILARARPVAFPLLVVAAAACAVGTHEEEHDTRDHRDRIVVKVEASVLIDRQALTLRTSGAAAILVLLLAPEAVAHPNFQMSFAATLALIAAYERGLPWKAKYADTPLGARIALGDVYEIAGLIFASLVAAPERRRTRPITSTAWRPTVLANLLAMPIVSAGMMPAGILGLVAMPFGFDDAMWRLIGMGIEWMKRHCACVANLSGACRLSAQARCSCVPPAW